MKSSVKRFAFAILVGLSFLGVLTGNLFAQTSQPSTAAPAKKYDTYDFHISNSTDTILDLLSKTSGDLTITEGEELGDESGLTDVPGEPPYRALAMTCGADLVVTGTATSGVSHMTARKNFLYTNWKFVIQEILKDNPEAPVAAGFIITVARPGGTLKIDGRTVRAKVPDFPDFESGRPYLLYLKFISGTKAYRADSRNTVPLFGRPSDDPALQDRSKLLEDTRASVSFEAGRSEGAWSTCAGKESAQ